VHRSTLETFETEWYERKATGKLAAASQNVPDIYSHNAVSKCTGSML
jgi:hypothetical protein